MFLPTTARLPLALLTLSLLTLAGVTTGAPATPPTPAQAQQVRGETLYVLACAMCHGDRLEGLSGPSLRGESFEAAFASMPPLGLHDLIRDTMPDGLRGSLTPQEVLDLTAYLLRENGRVLPEGGLDANALSELLARDGHPRP
ncbi:cytochrome c [Deinococcus depolymerans]|uniref:c-type cytochrome n=1 Tax=Deinococcus depolymerans TaxID=392408 RepID=UPI0031DE16CE